MDTGQIRNHRRVINEKVDLFLSDRDRSVVVGLEVFAFGARELLLDEQVTSGTFAQSYCKVRQGHSEQIKASWIICPDQSHLADPHIGLGKCNAKLAGAGD